MRLIVVPVGSAAHNDSTPDARTGQEVLREAQTLLQAGMTGQEVLAKLAVKWGPAEVIEAIAAGVGQRNFVEAVRKGRLYASNASPDESS
jgi:hypothetical protein